ncbi:hypothetical protein [Marinicrinis sediminis]|uniref:Uncharacterized protein n=1 Tax=Marinicrinis sediminis TaxID=1652465 RepID=A0ABW5RH89_9BACL
MGVKFGREYSDIHQELADAIRQVEGFYAFFEMERTDWEAQTEQEQAELAGTLADDLFYALGEDPVIEIGEGKLVYDRSKHVICVEQQDTVQIVRLV